MTWKNTRLTFYWFGKPFGRKGARLKYYEICDQEYQEVI